ncbi:Multidrug resistance-associated protein 4 [Folsomia candida]|uniref:Multidrug resistance-associated protein 4 n=1 Tax=Folsomia candida TaxID=158441 RepID=A0A226E252_FOLCA|nr:Multidrug resistance-associated protein 4 [Folsomia candida]
MATTSKGLATSPRISASLFSKMFFIWLYPLFNVGAKKDLEYEDLYNTLPEDEATLLGERLMLEWEKEMGAAASISESKESEPKNSKGKFVPSKPSLFKALVRMFAKEWVIVGIFLFLEECLAKIAQPIFLGYLLRYFNGEFDEKQGYFFATGVLLSVMYYTISHHPSFFSIVHLNMKIRVACSGLIYYKTLKLSQAALSKTTVGQVVNLLSSDVARFDFCLNFVHYLWIGPVQLLLSVWILWGYFGPTCFSGVIFLLLFTPFQSVMGHLFSKLRLKVAGKTDRRVRIMNEIINGIRVIKMYAWEIPFSKIVAESREDEIKSIGRQMSLRALNLGLYYVSSKLIIFLTLVAYVLTGNYLTAEKVFVAMALYQNVRLLMTIFFPWGISFLAETKVSLKRIENFLLLQDYVPPNRSGCKTSAGESDGDNEICLEMTNVSAKWSENSDLTLNKIDLTAPKGKLVAVVGPVGSGKSSLLQAILGELPIFSGAITVKGRIGYASQEAWVFSGTVRENILFGQKYNATWYQTVVDACALRSDFALMTFGDKTAVGDKGMTLSGGQRARISLARAIYANADVYVLDDILSAVDTEVGRHLFQSCIGNLLRNKICVLVTHQLQHLTKADEILLLNNGSIVARGDFWSLKKRDVNFSQILEEKNSVGSAENILKSEERTSSVGPSLSGSLVSVNNGCRNRKESLISVDDQTLIKAEQEIEKENQFFELLEVFNSSTTDFTSSLNNSINITNPEAGLDLTRSEQISIYTFLIIALFLMTLVRTIGFFKICMRSSIALHLQLFYGVLRAPMLFFELNPVGRILNRFVKDIGTIDELLPFTFFDTLEVGLQVLGVIVVVSIIDAVFLIPSTIIAILFYFIRNHFQITARNLKRLEGSARSPVFSHLSTSLNGLTTIRAFQTQDQFRKDFNAHLDLHTAVFYLFNASARWLGIVVDWISILYITCVTYGVIVLGLDGPSAGLAISSAMTLTSWFQWGVRQSAECENQLVAVERVVEYADIISEAPLESFPERKPQKNWPLKGEIEFQNVYVKYGSEEEPFLKNICCTIRPCEKVGIIGRTGSGKTSLISALFRLTEPSSGNIIIDGVNVLQIGLHDLRSQIAIIPQDPMLFVGTLRKNLDPFDEYADSEIWDVLRDVNLFEVAKDFHSGLDAAVNEGGSNFSVGQRQLICMGRAILRKNKILILDEATASVDNETDVLIQNTIREKFEKHCTIIAVAHRLHTVIDSDRIMVLEAGEIKEFDEPYKLLQNTSGAFFHFVQETGRDMAQELMRIAQERSSLHAR